MFYIRKLLGARQLYKVPCLPMLCFSFKDRKLKIKKDQKLLRTRSCRQRLTWAIFHRKVVAVVVAVVVVVVVIVAVVVVAVVVVVVAVVALFYFGVIFGYADQSWPTSDISSDNLSAITELLPPT